MIQANELRIGNFVNYVRGDLHTIVKVLDSRLLSILIYQENNIDRLYHKPIQITEDWILKLGAFHIEGWTWGFEIDDITTLSVTYAEGKYYWSLRQFDLKIDIYIIHLINDNLLYVHQLQNLYFALTQKELTCK